jgi:hypothetical protein
MNKSGAIWTIEVLLGTLTAQRPLSMAVIADQPRMRRILELKQRDWPRKNLEDKLTLTEFSSDDPRLPQLLSILAEEGWEPTFDIRFTDAAQKKFLVRRTRGKDLKAEKAAEFLIGFPATNGGWVRHMEPPFTVVAKCEPEEARKTAEVVALPGNSWGKRSGWSASAMKAWQASGLKGAVFRPVKWEPMIKRKVEISHWMDAELAFPPTLTPRVVNGRDITTNEEYFSLKMETGGFDDEGYVDYRLKYRRADLAHVMGLDIAGTWEQMEFGSARGPVHLLYSQRFRQWAIKQGYKFSWRPLTIVDQ